MYKLLKVKDISIEKTDYDKNYHIHTILTEAVIEDVKFSTKGDNNYSIARFIADDINHLISKDYYKLETLATFMKENFEEHILEMRESNPVLMALKLLKYLKRLEEFLGKHGELIDD